MLSEKADKIFKLKYARENETWEQACWRVASYVASIDDDKEEYEKKFFELIYNKVFIPGGRILANAGTNIKNLMNCFVLDVNDSRESIYSTLRSAAEIFAHGGGVGYNFSKIRETDADVISTGGKASGPLSFMTLFDQTGEVISQASRRGAQMAFLDCSHPDIEKFINYKSTPNSRNTRILEEYKRNLKKVGLNSEGRKYFSVLEKTLQDDQLSHFNISVMLNDDFMNASRRNLDWILTSRGNKKTHRIVNAKELLNLIAKMAWESGDPGVAFFDRINEDNIVKYYLGYLNTSNPCLYKDTFLVSSNGLKKISDNNQIDFTSWKTGIKSCIKITTNAGHELILTPDHRIMLENGEFIDAKNSLNKNLKWWLEENKSYSYEPAKVLGFLFGDGFICGNKFGISVKLNKEKELEIYNLLLKYNFKEEINGNLYINKNKLQNRIDVSILGSKSWLKEIPEYIMVSDKNFLGSFVSGLFEANGSVSILNQISYKTTSKKLAQQLQIVLGFFGVESWIVKNKPSLVKWKNGDYISKESYNLQIAPRNSYKFKERIGFISEYKNNKIKYIDGKYKSKLKVIAIENMGELEVWDFSNKTHYNFANGIIAHNCSELFLLPNESCCLGSINLSMFVDENDRVNLPFLEYVVRTAVRFLDNVQTISETPLPEINKVSKGLRRLGLGVMGWADMLAKLELPYDSEDAKNFGKRVSWFISFFAWQESIKLAQEKGAFPLYDKEQADLSVIDKVLN